MTDDERLLEIATRLMAGILGNQTLKVTAKADGATDIEAIAACSFAAADALMSEWRERTGAREERGQDVSVEMLQRAAVACRSAAATWSAIPTKSEYWCETADYFDKRARAAGKGEG
jgi:hypothetical protein